MPRIEFQSEGSEPAVFDLTAGRRFVLGRAEDADLKVVSEPCLSRKHAELWLEDGKLRVRRLPGSSNPIFYAGEPKEEFTAEAGIHFVIGKTRFNLLPEETDGNKAAAPFQERQQPQSAETLSPTEVYSPGASEDRLRLMDLFELPDILRTKDRGDFYLHLAGLLRLATGASRACVVSEDGKLLGEDASDDISVRYPLSRTLLRKALESSPQPTLYRWDKPPDFEATAQEGVDWAVCAAARIPGDPALIFYANGAGVQTLAAVREHARFMGLVADIVARTLSNDHLQEWQGRLRRFFAGPVIDKILASSGMDALKPRLAQSTVMFFDIRGFSKRTEQMDEKILGYVDEMRQAMTAMTAIILEEHGVILQYMGDGILACWNVPFDDPAHADRACRAGLRMARELGGVTEGWQCGIGIHTGTVVAGAIGSEQVFSYGILGVVVNQASRIEGLTKLAHVPILCTGEVAQRLAPGTARALRIGRFIPAGMQTPLELYALAEPGADDGHGAIYASGLAAFEKGDWDKTLEIMARLPVDHGPAQLLVSLSIENKRHPPLEWEGVIKVEQK